MVRINGMKFNDEEFYNGEVIFKKTESINDTRNVIEMNFKNNKDITAVLFARQWLAQQCPDAKCDLIMKYCPYERMDREIHQQMFSMKYFAEILTKFNFNKVFILDPHSEVCVNLLKENGIEVDIINLEEYVQKVVDDFQPDYICYPDKGAYEKYPEVLSGLMLPFFYGEKKRDLLNRGKIMNYELVGAPDLTDKKVLIIDDICCLGGTAYNAAVQMKKLGAKEVAFYISHCENGIFMGKLLKKEDIAPAVGIEILPWLGTYTIDKVYTADTMLLDQTHENITVIRMDENP